MNVKSTEGAVTGVYYGDLKSSSLIKNPDSLLMVINEGVGDTIVISFPACEVGGMNETDEISSATFSLKAIAKKEGDVWKISSEKSVVAVEKEDDSSTDYYMSINGTIGTTKRFGFYLGIIYECKENGRYGGEYEYGWNFYRKIYWKDLRS